LVSPRCRSEQKYSRRRTKGVSR